MNQNTEPDDKHERKTLQSYFNDWQDVFERTVERYFESEPDTFRKFLLVISLLGSVFTAALAVLKISPNVIVYLLMFLAFVLVVATVRKNE